VRFISRVSVGESSVLRSLRVDRKKRGREGEQRRREVKNCCFGGGTIQKGEGCYGR